MRSVRKYLSFIMFLTLAAVLSACGNQAMPWGNRQAEFTPINIIRPATNHIKPVEPLRPMTPAAKAVVIPEIRAVSAEPARKAVPPKTPVIRTGIPFEPASARVHLSPPVQPESDLRITASKKKPSERQDRPRSFDELISHLDNNIAGQISASGGDNDGFREARQLLDLARVVAAAAIAEQKARKARDLEARAKRKVLDARARLRLSKTTGRKTGSTAERAGADEVPKAGDPLGIRKKPAPVRKTGTPVVKAVKPAAAPAVKVLWNVREGERLIEVVRRIGSYSKYKVISDISNVGWIIAADGEYSGDFLGFISWLAQGFEDARPQPKITVFQNKVIKLEAL